MLVTKIKSNNLIRVVLTVMLLLSITTAANAALTNFNFDTGDLTGWTLNNPTLASVESSYSYSGTTYTAADKYFLRISAGLGANVSTTATQSFDINAGQSINGSAAFIAKDYMPYNDNASVRIIGSNGLISTLWTSNVSTVGNYGPGPWTSWSWIAPSSGTYSLEYAVANSVDNALSSDAVFAATAATVTVTTTPTPTPIPAAAWLFGSGLMGLAGVRRRKMMK